MANGLDADRLRQHWQHIQDVRESIKGIEVLCGIECDILEDATLDLPDDVLSEADWVIAVLHYGLKQPRKQIMKRLMCAIENPHVDIIGHPTGRLVSRREGADIDISDMLKAAADKAVDKFDALIISRGATPESFSTAKERLDSLKNTAQDRLGVDANITTVSLGIAAPICDDEDQACWVLNRSTILYLQPRG